MNEAEDTLTPGKPAPRALPHFEGLRGISAIWVVFAHFTATFAKSVEASHDQANAMIRDSSVFTEILFEIRLNIYDGHLPVFIFWFLSSVVISIKLFHPDVEKALYYSRHAAVKRYFRLGIPIFAASLISFLLLRFNLYHNLELSGRVGSLGDNAWLSRWFTSQPDITHFLKVTLFDLYLIGNNFYDFVLWSIPPELFGPLICFGIFNIMQGFRFRYETYLVILVFIFIGGISSLGYFAYFLFLGGYCYADLIYQVRSPESRYLSGLKTILASPAFPIILILLTYLLPHIFLLPTTLVYFLQYIARAIGITLLVSNIKFIRSLLSNKILVFLGAISFSVYLLHIPVLFSLGIWLHDEFWIANNWNIWILMLPYLGIVILTANLFHVYIDKPAQRFSNKFASMILKVGNTSQ